MKTAITKPNLDLSPSEEVGGRRLEQLEEIIDRGIPHYKEAAVALLEIHSRKLYKPASFKAYLKNRLNMSRSRGYQMLHFARLTKMSTMVDTGEVANERNARALASDGSAKSQKTIDPVLKAMLYLGDVFDKLSLTKKRDLIDYVRGQLDEMEAELLRDLA